MKWEYKTVAVETRRVTKSADVPEVDGVLAPLGAAGWELVAVLPPCEANPYFYLYTFKRPGK